MKCDCIKKIEAKLAEVHNDPEAKLDPLYDLPDLNERLYIPYLYRDKKKDGTFTKEKQGKLTLEKCPFCGKLQK